MRHDHVKWYSVMKYSVICSVVKYQIHASTPNSPWNVLPVDLLEACSLVEWDAPADGGEIDICMGRCRGGQKLLHDCSAYSLTPTAYIRQ